MSGTHCQVLSQQLPAVVLVILQTWQSFVWQIPESGVAGTKPASILFAMASILVLRPATPAAAKIRKLQHAKQTNAVTLVPCGGLQLRAEARRTH